MQLWFCEIRGSTVGPITFEQLAGLASTGEVTQTTNVRKSEDDSWKPAADIVGLFDSVDGSDGNEQAQNSTSKVDPKRLCQQCGRHLNPKLRKCQYCGFDASAVSDAESDVSGTSATSSNLLERDESRVEITSIGQFYLAPFKRSAGFLSRLDWWDTAKKILYLIGGLLAIGMVLFVFDILVMTSASFFYAVALIGLSIIVIGLVINALIEWLVVGVGLLMVRHPYPGPETSVRAVCEVVLARLMVGLFFGLAAILLLPILVSQESSASNATGGILGIGLNVLSLVFCYLIAVSIYSQRLSMPAAKSAVVSLLSLLMFGGLGAVLTLLRTLLNG